MPIGRAAGPLSADVHASIPGVVKELREIRLPDGELSPAVVIALEGEFARTGRARTPVDWRTLSRGELLAKLEAGGVVGLDGVPAATRLRVSGRPEVLVVNGAESEPYLTCDERLMVEKAAEVLSGAAIAAAILGAGSVEVGIEANKPDALRVMAGAAAGFGCRVTALRPRYPQGEEQLMVRALTGRRVPRGGRPEDAGAVVLNVGTLLAIHEAVVLDLPHIERVVTVAGEGVPLPANLKARLGTPVAALLEECGGLAGGRVIVGGAMRGFALDGLDTPLTKGMAGVLALSRRETRAAGRTACIGCGRCISACPWELRPVELYKWLEHGELAEARSRGLGECTECGCCSYVCPARIPLLEGLASGRRRGAA
jgi:electron transport complex protein RnfC